MKLFTNKLIRLSSPAPSPSIRSRLRITSSEEKLLFNGSRTPGPSAGFSPRLQRTTPGAKPRGSAEQEPAPGRGAGLRDPGGAHSPGVPRHEGPGSGAAGSRPGWRPICGVRGRGCGSWGRGERPEAGARGALPRRSAGAVRRAGGEAGPARRGAERSGPGRGRGAGREGGRREGGLTVGHGPHGGECRSRRGGGSSE